MLTSSPSSRSQAGRCPARSVSSRTPASARHPLTRAPHPCRPRRRDHRPLREARLQARRPQARPALGRAPREALRGPLVQGLLQGPHQVHGFGCVALARAPALRDRASLRRASRPAAVPALDVALTLSPQLCAGPVVAMVRHLSMPILGGGGFPSNRRVLLRRPAWLTTLVSHAGLGGQGRRQDRPHHPRRDQPARVGPGHQCVLARCGFWRTSPSRLTSLGLPRSQSVVTLPSMLAATVRRTLSRAQLRARREWPG